MSAAAAVRTQAIQSLRRQLLASPRSRPIQQIVPTCLASLDAILPNGGLPSASIVEWISEDMGIAAASIALTAIAPMFTQPGCLAIVDECHDFYPGAVQCSGIPLSRMLLIRPPRSTAAVSVDNRRQFVRQSSVAHSSALWALEQTARCSGVRVVLTFLAEASSAVMRRLQLAVEESGVTMVLIRPVSVLRQPSFADLRLHVTAARPVLEDVNVTGCCRLKIRLLRSRHGLQHTGSAQLEVDHETSAVHSISELADPKPATTPAF
jgi:protein ImuA